MDMLFFMILPAIICIGIITSYEDMRYRKIRNRWIIISILYSIIAIFAASLIIILSEQILMLSYIADFITNVIFSIAFGFVTWYLGLWSAGDSKLFIAYSFLLPLSVYSNGYISLFPSFVIIINTCFIMLPYFAANILSKCSIMRRIRQISNLDKRILIRPIISLFSLSWVARQFMFLMGLKYDAFMFFILLPIVYFIIDRTIGKRAYIAYIVIAPLRFLFDYQYIFSFKFVYYFLFMIIFYIIISEILFKTSYDIFSSNIRIEKLRPGMMPAEIVYKDKNEYKKQPLDASLDPETLSNIRPIFGPKLTKENIQKLKDLSRSNKIDPMLRIYHTMPFALFIFLGVLITILFEGNIIIFLKNLV